MDKTELIGDMKTLQATAFALYLKAQNYHWNVTGPLFSEYHEFFGDVYQQVYESVDVYAEHIRALGAFAPGAMARFIELSRVTDELMVPKADVMISRLTTDNQTLLSLLRLTRGVAEAAEEFGVVNFLEGQIDAHEKLGWKLRSFVEVI